MALANLNADRGQYDEAAEFARQAIRTNPGSGTARLALVRALLGQESLSSARAELEPVLGAAPNLSAALLLLGEIQVRQADPVAARQSFARALDSDPRAVEALAGLVNLDLNAKRHDEAVRRVQAQIAKAPDSANLLLVAGRTYAATGDLVRAEASLRKAIEIDPSFMEGIARSARRSFAETGWMRRAPRTRSACRNDRTTWERAQSSA